MQNVGSIEIKIRTVPAQVFVDLIAPVLMIMSYNDKKLVYKLLQGFFVICSIPEATNNDYI